MIAEILCVGTELLMGQVLNTNAQYIARRLAALGVSIYHQQVVGDNDTRLEEAYRLALSREISPTAMPVRWSRMRPERAIPTVCSMRRSAAPCLSVPASKCTKA